MEERRRFERVKPADDCIVVHSRKVGNIKNISSGGLYCSCFQDATCKTNVQREIDILCGQGQFLVKGVKVRVVETETVAGKFLINFEIRNCRLQFVDMADEQSQSIASIIAGACVH